MLLTLIALTAALFLITSNALSIDTSAHHLARHHHIAARQPVKRASVSAKCRNRNSSSAAPPPSTSLPASTATPAAPAPTTSQAPAPPSSPSGGSGKVGLAWAYGDDPHLKNFITGKVSAYVLIYSFFPFTFRFLTLPLFPAFTLGDLLDHKTFLDCSLLQCYGVTINLVNSKTLSRLVMQILLWGKTSKTPFPFLHFFPFLSQM